MKKNVKMDALEKMESMEESQNDTPIVDDKTGNNEPFDRMMRPITEKDNKDLMNWNIIDRKYLPNGGKLYKDSLTFRVKPATGKAVRNFSCMDETNALQVVEGMDAIINNFVDVRDGNRMIKNSSDIINRKDRIFFVMLVHEYTKTENNLMMKLKCPHCGKEHDYMVKYYNIANDYNMDEVEKKVNSDGVMVFQTKSLGNITFRETTQGRFNEFKDFILEYKKANLEVENGFYKAVEFFDDGVTKFSELYKRYVIECNQQPKLFDLMISIRKDILKSKEITEVQQVCDSCKATFRDTYKIEKFFDLFTVPDILDEIL